MIAQALHTSGIPSRPPAVVVKRSNAMEECRRLLNILRLERYTSEEIRLARGSADAAVSALLAEIEVVV